VQLSDSHSPVIAFVLFLNCAIEFHVSLLMAGIIQMTTSRIIRQIEHLEPSRSMRGA
jgi:hypothetical protein